MIYYIHPLIHPTSSSSIILQRIEDKCFALPGHAEGCSHNLYDSINAVRFSNTDRIADDADITPADKGGVVRWDRRARRQESSSSAEPLPRSPRLIFREYT